MTECESVLIVMHDESMELYESLMNRPTPVEPGHRSFVETHRLVRYCTVQFSRSELERRGALSDRILRPVRRTMRWSHDEQYIASVYPCQA